MEAGKKEPIKCPGCGRELDKNKSSAFTYFPFCSRRCKLADLEGWLGNRYKIPAPEDSENKKE